MIIHDLRCTSCGLEEANVACQSGANLPRCEDCGGARTWVPTRLNTDIFGQSVYYKSLDREFASKSDLKSYLKANGLQEAGDRKGGARNESHLGLGKTFSYRGQASRTTASEGK